MRRSLALPAILAALAAAAAVLAFGWGRPRPVAPLAGAEGNAPGATEGAGSADSAEARRLRAELATKDGVIRALTAQAIAKDAERVAAVGAAAAEAARTPASRAASRLDERLAASPANAAAKAELEAALRPALDPQALGAARVEDLRCAGALCKISLSAASDAQVVPAANALAEHLPKSFAASIVLPLDDGQRAIFVGRSSADLALDEAPAPAHP